MAPAISLPLSRASARPRWADVEDCGTPTPYASYAQPDFNLKEVDAFCDTAQPTKWPESQCPQMPTLLNSNQGAFHMLSISQPCQAFSEKVVHGLPLVGFQGPYVALAQSCPVYSEMPGTCVTSQQPQQQLQQQHFPCHEADTSLHNVNEMVMQAPQAWAVEFNSSNNTMDGNAYTMGAQWPVYAIPCQQSTSAESSSQEDSFEVQPPAQQQQQPSQQHGSGQCRPCAWFWRKQGCKNAEDCGYCHECPEGELKARKKSKIAAMRMGALAPVKASSQTNGNGGWGLKLDSLVQGKS